MEPFFELKVSQVMIRKVKTPILENEVFDYEHKKRLEELADHAPFFFKFTGIILLFELLPFNFYCSDIQNHYLALFISSCLYDVMTRTIDK